MNYLVTGDVHFSSEPKDDYRWDLWPYLGKVAENYDCGALVILGDLTVAKDRHPSLLVNRLIDAIMALPGALNKVCIIKGNHDYIQESDPFFSFLNYIPGVEMHSQPSELESGILLLPNSPFPKQLWQEANIWAYDLVFAHQTVAGAVSSTGRKLDGLYLDPPPDSKTKILAGDIHVPQKIGCLEYVGAPYHVHFGDTYEPRVVVIEGETLQTISVPTLFPNKTTIEISDPAELGQLMAGTSDMVRIRYKAAPSAQVEWPRVRQEIADQAKRFSWNLQQVEMQIGEASPASSVEIIPSFSDQDIVKDWSAKHQLSDAVSVAGSSIVKGE